jgi:hypothetical protein
MLMCMTPQGRTNKQSDLGGSAQESKSPKRTNDKKDMNTSHIFYTYSNMLVFLI